MFHVELWSALQVHNSTKLTLLDFRIVPRGTYQATLNINESPQQETSGACSIRFKSPR